MRLGLVWAEARGRVIGRDGSMPWSVPSSPTKVCTPSLVACQGT